MSGGKGKRRRRAVNHHSGNLVTDSELRSDLESDTRETSQLDGETTVTLSINELRLVVGNAVSQIINELKSELSQRFDDLDSQLLDLTRSIASKFDDVTKYSKESNKVLGAKIDKINLTKEPNIRSGPTKTLVKPMETAINKAMREKDERESKKKNIILFNVPECNVKDIQKRVKHDVAHVKELTDTLEINPDIKNIIRLGKADDSKIRPILLKLESEDQKQQFLSTLKNWVN